MKVLFLCTAFNSLSQRLSLVLKSRGHTITVELALSPELMVSAAELASPDIIICPFLTKRVPPAIYNRWLTLIVHPGPPGDAGPSALDWTLLGDSGESERAEDELTKIDGRHRRVNGLPPTRSHWGVTVLQAIEAFDAGPVWAFDQFELDQHTSQMSKSDLYRGPVTRAAVSAVLSAVEIIQIVAKQEKREQLFSPELAAPAFARVCCVSNGVPFQGGKTYDRPLLKASSRDFLQLNRNMETPLSAEIIVQRIRCGDSQPGVLTSLFASPMFIYDAVIQSDPLPLSMTLRAQEGGIGTVLATRHGAVLVEVGADKPIWISHLRRPKAKADKYLHPKLPATMALMSVPNCENTLELFSNVREWDITNSTSSSSSHPWERRSGTYQQVWVELEDYANETCKIGYIHSEFYNGAFSTSQCELLLGAIKWTLAQPGIKAVVMLGGTGYFSNGIALNVIEGSSDSSAEGWANINAIDDCVQALLAPAGVVTFAAIRGNAAAGGLALATAADVVLCAESAVLNPHYRGVGLYGSEWHTYSWYERCGSDVAAAFVRNMLPMSSKEAYKIGLVDFIIENHDVNSDRLLTEVKIQVRSIMTSVTTTPAAIIGAPWTKPLRPVLTQTPTLLSEHMLRNKAKFLAYTFAGDSEDNLSIHEHFQKYRKHELDQMALDFFHPCRNQRFATRCRAFVRKLVPTSTPLRFALHRRFEGSEWNEITAKTKHWDEEELDEFDSLDGLPAEAAISRLPSAGPEQIHKPVTTRVPRRPTLFRYDSNMSTASTLYDPESPPFIDDLKAPLSQLCTPGLGPTPQKWHHQPSVDAMQMSEYPKGLGLNLPDEFGMVKTFDTPSLLSPSKRFDNAQTPSVQETPILWSCYYSETGV